jgi:hypothetical protein
MGRFVAGGLVAVWIILLVGGVPMSAGQNLVYNGDFSLAGDGWTISFGSGSIEVGYDLCAFATYDGLGYIGQNLTTVDGGAYTIQFLMGGSGYVSDYI